MVEYNDGPRLAEKSISESGQAAYLESAFRSIDRGSQGVPPNDAFHIEVDHQVPLATSAAMSFIAPRIARDLQRDLIYFPYELQRGWVDEL